MSEKELEEGEVRIDNLLRKIIKANEHISMIVSQLHDVKYKNELEMIEILTKTINNLAVLADDIDKHDEDLTKEMEADVRVELKAAVQRISEASRLI